MNAISDSFLVSLQHIFGQTYLSQFPEVFYVFFNLHYIYCFYCKNNCAALIENKGRIHS